MQLTFGYFEWLSVPLPIVFEFQMLKEFTTSISFGEPIWDLLLVFPVGAKISHMI
jgi:hypothetical protein